MKRNEPSDFGEGEVWSATVKYRDKPDLTFLVTKSETVSALKSIEDDMEHPIRIGAALFERENLDYIALEGRTYQFAEKEA